LAITEFAMGAGGGPAAPAIAGHSTRDSASADRVFAVMPRVLARHGLAMHLPRA
jgi:hypothetical protein